MNRSTNTPAVVLSLKPLGENNSQVTLLTPEQGIIYATLYGGPKSKLRSLVSQWNSGNVWLYEVPEKNQIKITDFEVRNYHGSFSENLFKMYAASLAAELAIKTRCGGSNKEAFILISGFFDGMELCNEEQSRVGLIRFLWRYLELLGVQPEAHICNSCGKSFLETRFAPDSISYYNSISNSFICSECQTEEFDKTTFLQIKGTALQYLSAITFLSPAEVRKLQIDEDAYNNIKQLVFFLIETNIDQKLNTIEIGVGIL